MKKLVSFFVTLSMLFALTVPTMAASLSEAGESESAIMPRDTELTSYETSDTFNGVTYNVYSSLYVGNQYRAGIWVIADATLPEEKLQAQAYLYDDSKAVLASSGWVKNGADMTFHYAITGKVSSSERVVAYGECKVPSTSAELTLRSWYIDSDDKTFRNFNVRSAEPAEYGVTETGETYGSLMLAEQIGYKPDLIYAVGVDGTRGYVRLEDFDVEITDGCELIDLYDLNGTVIGQYQVGMAAETEEVPAVQEKVRQLAECSGVTAQAVSADARSDAGAADEVNAYPITDNGQTYGCLPDAQQMGCLPDLIYAVGDHGVRGFLKRADHVVENVVGEKKTVALYDLKGNVVDSFTFFADKL